MSHDLQKRVQQLEEVIAHQEHLLQQLNEVVVQLRAEHERLRARFAAEVTRLATAIAESHSEPFDPNEKPPHF